MDKAFEIQKQVRDNTKILQSYLTDLQNWEDEMKRKEAALNGDFEQDLPPIRSKTNKGKPVQTVKKPEKRISASDYKAWEQFDVDKACEDVDMVDIGPVSLDSKMSEGTKQERLKEEAQYEKERGNQFVKQEKWEEALSCYNRAIELVKNDAIYYANRGLCHLKRERYHQAESDCTEALRLDPTYVKAFQRRAAARECLGSLRAASNDLIEVLKLEPHNAAARRQLETIKARMGTKGTKSKSSPSATPIMENKPIVKTGKPRIQPKTIEVHEQLPKKPEENKELSESEKWRDGIGENITVIKPVKKPPHLRSKRALKSIPIQEIPMGSTIFDQRKTRIQIIEIEPYVPNSDTNNNDTNKISEKIIDKINDKDDVEIPSPESEKMLIDSTISEKDVRIERMVAPINSVQFMAEWKYLKEKAGARSDYLSIIEPSKIPSIFENALESDVLSDILHILHEDTNKFKAKTIAAYLRGLCGVKRFSTLAMFLPRNDKELLTKLLDYCKTVEKCTDEEIADLKNKYEL